VPVERIAIMLLREVSPAIDGAKRRIKVRLVNEASAELEAEAAGVVSVFVNAASLEKVILRVEGERRERAVVELQCGRCLRVLRGRGRNRAESGC
jgi:hypothetical protein